MMDILPIQFLRENYREILMVISLCLSTVFLFKAGSNLLDNNIKVK